MFEISRAARLVRQRYSRAIVTGPTGGQTASAACLHSGLPPARPSQAFSHTSAEGGMERPARSCARRLLCSSTARRSRSAFPVTDSEKNGRDILHSTMNRSLKTFLLWLLIAVLPLNAVAGSLGMSCASLHQQSQVSAGTAAMHHAPAADEHAPHGGEHAGHTAQLPSDTDSPSPDVDQQSHGSCSACSTFCVGAVVPSSTNLTVPSFDGSDAAAASPAAFAVGFIQDGPQRPPRH